MHPPATTTVDGVGSHVADSRRSESLAAECFRCRGDSLLNGCFVAGARVSERQHDLTPGLSLYSVALAEAPAQPAQRIIVPLVLPQGTLRKSIGVIRKATVVKIE